MDPLNSTSNGKSTVRPKIQLLFITVGSPWAELIQPLVPCISSILLIINCNGWVEDTQLLFVE